MVSLDDVRHRFKGMHVYDGNVMSGVFPTYKIDAARDHVFNWNDVIVATYPKSGTTWMQEIAWLLINDCNFEAAEHSLLDDRCLFLEQELPGPVRKKPKHHPTLIKTHLKQHILDEAITKGNPRVIVVMRNPKDVLVSQYHFYRMNQELGCFLGTWDEFFEMFKNKELLFGFWLDHIAGWWQHCRKPNYHFVTYEQMKLQPKEILAKLAAFLNIDMSDEVLDRLLVHTTFDKMKMNTMVNKENRHTFDQNISKFMRKGVVGDWKNYFSHEQSEFVDQLCEGLKEQGLQFIFE